MPEKKYCPPHDNPLTEHDKEDSVTDVAMRGPHVLGSIGGNTAVSRSGTPPFEEEQSGIV